MQGLGLDKTKKIIIIFNELKVRDFNVDVGVISINEKNINNNNVQKQCEVDFVATLGSKKVYIQPALSVDSKEKMLQEARSLNNTLDSFRKIIAVKDAIKHWYTDTGIEVVGIKGFLTSFAL